MIDIKDDLDALYGPQTDKAAVKALAQQTEWKQTCGKCGGSGIYKAPSSYGHQCFACDGRGYAIFKTSPEQRAKAARARAASAEKKARAKQEQGERALAEFEAKHPEIAQWWTNSDFDFACQMRLAVMQYGSLTERQMGAVERCVAKRKEAIAAAVERKANAPVVSIEAIEECFAKAKAQAVNPKLRLAGFVFSYASETSANAGALYIKSDGVYLGKIMGGKLFTSRDCNEQQRQEIMEVAAQPKDAAIKYGRVTGSCAICNRRLDNAESVERGIGPICAEKFGW